MAENAASIKNHIDRLYSETLRSMQNGDSDRAMAKLEEMRRKTHHIIDMMMNYEQALVKMNSQMKGEQEIERKIIGIQKVEESAIKKLKRQLGN
jgi:outer membrane protein assembly factor BamD (BamD/ComL family)